MRNGSRLLSAYAAAFAVAGATAVAQNAPALGELAMTDSEFRFGNITPAPLGITSALPVGSLAVKGIYVLRNKIAPHVVVPPHSHPTWRIMNVIQGTVYFAYGRLFDLRQEKPYGPGSLIVEPAGAWEFFSTSADGAVIQFVGEGPLETRVR